MPFTPAHPAILFPLRGRRLHPYYWSALVIGTMVPDLEYFVWMDSASVLSHTVEGIFLFDLPMTILLAFLWHLSLRDGILKLIPFIKDKYLQKPDSSFTEWFKKHGLAYLSLAVLGVALHLIWDGFTHAKGWMVERIPWLLQESGIPLINRRWCYILWYLSSIFGLAYLAHWITDRKKWIDKGNWKRLFADNHNWWIVFAVLAPLIFTLRCMMGLQENVPRHLVIIAIGSTLYAAGISSWWTERKNRYPEN